MGRYIRTSVAAFCFAILPATACLANCESYWTEAYKRLQGCLGGGGGGPAYVPAPVPQPSPQELKQRQSVAFNNQGNDQFKRGKYAEAIRLYERALELATTPESVRINRQNIANVRSRLAERAQKSGDLETALREIEQAIQYDSEKKFDWAGWAANLRRAIADRNEEAAGKRQLEIQAGDLGRIGQQITASEQAQAQERSKGAQSGASLDFFTAAAMPAKPTTRAGIFGTSATPQNPDLGPAEGSGRTTYNSASAQAAAAASDPTRVFDGRPGAATGAPLQFPTAGSQRAKVDALTDTLAKSPEAMNDPLISTSLKWYRSLGAQVSEKQAQIAEVSKQLEAGSSDAQVLRARKESLEADIKRSEADRAAAEKQIRDQVKKLNISINWQEGPPDSAAASASNPAPGVSNAALSH